MRKKGIDRQEKLKKAADFAVLFKEGKRLSSENISLLYLKSNKRQIGFAVSKKIGKAVKRNFARRRVKEIVRVNHNQLPENAKLVFLAKTGAESQKFDLLQSQVLSLLGRLKKDI